MKRAKATLMAICFLCARAALAAAIYDGRLARARDRRRAVAAPPAPPAPGVLGGPIGQALDERTALTAIAAQQEAVASGTRKSWRGDAGAYGFVTPGAENGSCRDYTHEIFINGRPQEAKGQACRQDGEWRVDKLIACGARSPNEAHPAACVLGYRCGRWRRSAISHGATIRRNELSQRNWLAVTFHLRAEPMRATAEPRLAA